MYYVLMEKTGKFLAIKYDEDGNRQFYETDEFSKAFKTQDLKTLKWFSDKYQNKNNEWGEGLF